jgi:hypothetical protein
VSSEKGVAVAVAVQGSGIWLSFAQDDVLEPHSITTLQAAQLSNNIPVCYTKEKFFC